MKEFVSTQLPLDKMATKFDNRHFQMHFFTEKDRVQIRISLKFVPKSPIDNKPPLVQVMAWRRTGDKSLPEPMMSQSIDPYMRH